MVIRTLQTRVFLLAAALLCLMLTTASANVAVSPLFSSHMVIQRDRSVPVYGTASSGETVTVKFNGQQVSTTADSMGNWQVMLAPMTVNKTAQSMTITGNNTISISDVLIGDVWMCSGQSNAAFGLSGCNRQTDIDTANFPGIRHFGVPLATSQEPSRSVSGSWYVCSPSTASGFSAVAFYFARKIYQDQNTNIPIGIITTAVGGTRIDPWLAPEGAASIPTLQPLFSQGILPWGPFCLFNGQVYPLSPYASKGLIWYQGENSETTVQSPDSYYLKLKALSQGWKSLFAPDDFAFYVVQIANYGTVPSSPTPVLSTGGWDADTRLQEANAMSLPHAGMASAIDIGETDDMHPKDKLDLGERLALWALKNDYGRTSLVTSGPILKDVSVVPTTGDYHAVVCSFDYVGSGLMVGSKTPYQPTQEVIGGTLQRFSIAGADKVWYAATAVISGNTVVLSSTSVKDPKMVSYACWGNPLGCNLYNKEGLPASPFHVDDVTAKFAVNASANTGGTISPAGATTYLKRHTALYTITPSAGYYIQDVKVDGVSVGSVKHYTFDPLYANHTISATFASTAPNYTVTATATPGGSISPSGAQTVAQGGSKTFTITPDPGNKLLLNVDGFSVGARSSFSFGDVRANHTISASFAVVIDAQAGYGGTISPSGENLVNCGDSKTFTITPMAGFAVSNVKIDGIGIGPVTSYTFSNVSTSHSIVVSFAGGVAGGLVPQQSQLMFSFLTDSLPASGAISTWSSYLPAGKTLTALGSPTVKTIDGRKFEQNTYVDADGFSLGTYSTSTPCTGATAVVVAKSSRNGFSSGWTSIIDLFYDRFVLGIKNDTGKICVRCMGSLTESSNTIPAGQTTILSMVVQPDGTYKVYADGAQIMSGTGNSAMTSLGPNGGFNSIYIGRGVDSWAAFDGNIGDIFFYKTALSDGERQQLEAYLTGRLISNAGTTTYGITASAGTGGTISPAGVVVVTSGSGQLYTITPNIGYAIDDVKVDNVSVGAVPSYTFTNVTANHTISATFHTVPTVTISASAGTGGTITPNGSVVVNSGGNQTFTIAPSTGFTIADVKVDGSSVGVVTTYTFNNATANHTIAATFNALPVTVTGKVTDITTGAVISGASVYFAASSNPSVNPTYTATTDASGNYSQTLPVGTWYAAAKKAGYDLSADQTIMVTAGSSPTANFALALTPIIGTEVFYRFNETSGTTATDSVSGKNGTLVNGPVWAAGKANNCLNFDGSNDYVSVPDLGDYAGLTISAWVNIDSLGTDATGSAIVACDGSEAGDIQFLILKSGGKMRFSLIGNTAADNDSTYAFTSADFGKWRHVAVVYDSVAKTVKFYINGGLNTTKTLTTTRLATLSTGVRVGSWSGSRYFDGKIDDFHIYGRALSASDIAAIVNSAPSTKISDAKKLANGEVVTLADKVVTYAPRNASNTRNTNYFYVEEPDRSAGVFVQNVSATKDNLNEGSPVSVAGVMKTVTYTGQRYLEISALPGPGTASAVNALGMNIKTIQNDTSAQGLLVRASGKVVEISPDKDWFTMTDGYGFPTIVICETGIPLSGFIVGDSVVVTGAVGRDIVFGDSPESVIYPTNVVKI